MATTPTLAESAEILELAELLRQTGDILADELSVLNHTTFLSGACRDALTDWDSLSFKLRQSLRAAIAREQGK